jgi:hypothetical protein
MVALNWTMKNIYDVEPGEVFWAASDVGWVVGHSYIVYAPLLARLHHHRLRGQARRHARRRHLLAGDRGAQGRLLFTAPTAFRAIKRDDPKGEHRRYDLSSLRALFLAGERADPDTIVWAQKALGVPVIDHWWQTETGWAIAGNPLGIEPLPVKLGSPTVPMPGYDVQILDEDGHEPVAPANARRHRHQAAAAAGLLPTLWNADERFVVLSRRLPGLLRDRRRRADGRGRLSLHHGAHRRRHQRGRPPPVDRRMEEVLAAHPDVAECAVIGVADQLKGQLPLGFPVPQPRRRPPHGRDRARNASSWCATRSARSRPSRAAWWSTGCPRPARARSCAAPWSRSPTARTSRCRRPSTTRRSSTRSAIQRVLPIRNIVRQYRKDACILCRSWTKDRLWQMRFSHLIPYALGALVHAFHFSKFFESKHKLPVSRAVHSIYIVRRNLGHETPWAFELNSVVKHAHKDIPIPKLV